MKKTMLTLALIATAIASFSQTTPPSHSGDYHVTKSRHQKTAAWVMLGGGVVLTALGFGLASAGSLNNAMGGSDKSNTTANVLGYVGIVSSLGSIPLFISAAHNRHKAAMFSFNMQKLPMLCTRSYHMATLQPAITLKILS